jgi:sugar O-acyltransferase (sialic acid O-acetyltransferase NeuD family)
VIQDLVILGAGGSAGAIVETIDAINAVSPRWKLCGFLDDTPDKIGSSLFDYPVLGPIDSARRMHGAAFVIGIASHKRPFGRTEMAERIGVSRERYATLVHPLASISPNAAIGSGVLVFQFAVISNNATVADHVYVSPFCFVGHHSTIETGATLAPRASLLGGSRFGPAAYAASHAVVRDGVSVGEGAIVGMGSMVFADVPPRVTVVGNPARQIAGVKRTAT